MVHTTSFADGFARLVLLASFVLPFLPRTAGAQTAITTCGQEDVSSGYLTADLDCTGFNDYAVELEPGGSLDLRGFTITGGEYGVFCNGSCAVFGGGTVTGAVEDGIAALKTIKVDDVTSSNNGFTGVKGGKTAIVTNSVLTGNGRSGVQSLGRVKLINIISQGNAGAGTDSGLLARIIGSTLTGNALGGALSDRISARDSSILDNASDPRCGVSLACADVMTSDVGKKPRLNNVDCATSYKGGNTPPGETWGVCSDD